MRLDIPLLPISVEVRWRRLPPIRVTLRGLMIGVVLAGLFFTLLAHLGRMNRAHQYHREQASLASRVREMEGIVGLSPLEAWHSAMADLYHRQFERIDVLAFLIFMTFATLAVVAVLGRALDWSARRLGFPTADGPTDHRPTSYEIPNSNSEEPRP